jgi:TatD DNase family protein
MDLFDTHCHLDVDAFDADRTKVLGDARAAQVKHLLVPAIARGGWEALWALCETDPGLYPAIGLHPVLLEQHCDQDIDALAAFVQHHRPVAIGEIGLDFFVKELDRERQQALLEAQLAIAEQHRLPVVLHVRKAHDQMLQTLKRFDLCGGTCHAFNGSLQQAGQYIEMGFRLGFGGMLTYPNAHKLHKLARELPLDCLVLETDAPDMTGVSHRYQRNSPAYLPEALHKLAELRAMPAVELAHITTGNAMQAFAIKDRHV